MTGSRNGVYYLEQGIGPIVARVDYDRKGSAIARARAGRVAVRRARRGSRPVRQRHHAGPQRQLREEHRTGPAPGEEAQGAGVLRRELPQEALEPKGADELQVAWTFLDEGWITALITTETDARTVFKHRLRRGRRGAHRGAHRAAASKVLQAFKAKYADKCELYVLTIRKRVTNETGVWTSAALLPEGAYVVGDVFDYTILDRPGAGDACSAGLIAGCLGIQRDGSINDQADLALRVKMGLDLGNRAAIVAQKTVGDIGPVWDARMYFDRVSESKEIAR
jgi:hypothetical protein